MADVRLRGWVDASALLLPRLLDRLPDRSVTLVGAALVVGTLIRVAAFIDRIGPGWPVPVGAWLLIGFGSSAVLTPSGRLLRRSARAEDRAAVFAAQSALSHAC